MVIWQWSGTILVEVKGLETRKSRRGKIYIVMINSLQAHSPDIQCDGCAQSIQRVLEKLPGIQSVQVDVQTKNISVQYDSSATTETAIHTQLTKAGFPPQQEA